MTLTERIRAAECAVHDCHEPRAAGAVVCTRHLNDLWCHRLLRVADGTYIESHLTARDESGWSRAA
jgi:hypothetical protein